MSREGGPRLTQREPADDKLVGPLEGRVGPPCQRDAAHDGRANEGVEGGQNHGDGRGVGRVTRDDRVLRVVRVAGSAGHGVFGGALGCGACVLCDLAVVVVAVL